MDRLELIENKDGTYTVVEMLEALLERARAGDFKTMAFAATREEGITTGWTTPTPGHHCKLIGCMTYLQFRMHKEMDEE